MMSYVNHLIRDDFGAFVGYCLSIFTVMALVICLLKHLLKRYYGIEIFIGERQRSARARQRLEQVSSDAALAAQLEREFEEEERRKMIEQKREARRAKAKEMLEGVTMTVKKEDIIMGEQDLETRQAELVVRLPAAASTEIGIERVEPAYCAVCLAEYELGDAIVWSLNANCKHVFHDDCILTWLSRGKRQCPCCRESFLDPPKEMVVEERVLRESSGADSFEFRLTTSRDSTSQVASAEGPADLEAQQDSFAEEEGMVGESSYEDIAEKESEEDYLEERRRAVGTEEGGINHPRRRSSVAIEFTDPSLDPSNGADTEILDVPWALPGTFGVDCDTECSVRLEVSGTDEVAAASSLNHEGSSKDSGKQ